MQIAVHRCSWRPRPSSCYKKGGNADCSAGAAGDHAPSNVHKTAVPKASLSPLLYSEIPISILDFDRER